MTCGRCEKEIEADSTFCRFCGAQVHEPPRARRLMRVLGDGKLGGVCAGIARYLDIDPTVVRLVWVILSVVPGILIGGVIAYAVAWVLLPVDRDKMPDVAVRRLHRSTDDRKIAGVCGGFAHYFGVDSTLVRIVAAVLAIYPGAVICGVLLYLIAWFMMPLEAVLEPSPSMP